MVLIAQGIGIFAMTANILSYQFKFKQKVLCAQLIGAALFAINMFMLDAVMGGILNFIAVIRSIIYINSAHLPWNLKYVNAGFMLLYAVSYGLVFTLFGKSPTAMNLIIELLPLIGMGAMTVGFSKTGAKAIRICGLINSPCWLIYNCVNLAIGGILCEVICLFSILSAYLRLDANKTK